MEAHTIFLTRSSQTMLTESGCTEMPDIDFCKQFSSCMKMRTCWCSPAVPEQHTCDYRRQPGGTPVAEHMATQSLSSNCRIHFVLTQKEGKVHGAVFVMAIECVARELG